MISMTFFLHLILAFAVGSIWVTIITIIAEKKGSTIGGILGGLPSTSAFSFFFIGINQSSTAAVQATTVFPLAFGITTAYLFFYSFFAKKSFSRGIIISMIIWFALSGLIVASGLNDFALSLAGGIVISSFTYYCFTKKIKLQNFKGEKRNYKISEVVLRGIGAGSLVLLSVFLSQIGRSRPWRHCGCVSSGFSLQL